MTYAIMLLIEEGNAPAMTAEAHGKDEANVFIKAATLREAGDLLQTAEGTALEACRNWTETPRREEETLHYITQKKSIEEMEADAAAYEQTPEGKRFQKILDNAKAFYYKRSKRGSGNDVTNINYLANKHRNSLVNGSFDLAALAYRQGYNAAKRDAQKGKGTL